MSDNDLEATIAKIEALETQLEKLRSNMMRAEVCREALLQRLIGQAREAQRGKESPNN